MFEDIPKFWRINHKKCDNIFTFNLIKIKFKRRNKILRFSGVSSYDLLDFYSRN